MALSDLGAVYKNTHFCIVYSVNKVNFTFYKTLRIDFLNCGIVDHRMKNSGRNTFIYSVFVSLNIRFINRNQNLDYFKHSAKFQ